MIFDITIDDYSLSNNPSKWIMSELLMRVHIKSHLLRVYAQSAIPLSSYKIIL